MPVQWAKIEMPLAGLDQKTAAAHVMPGKLVMVENARFDNFGNLVKRKGWDVLSAAIPTQTPYRLVTHRDGVHVCDDRFFYHYAATTGNWYDRGSSPSYHAERIPALRPSESTSGSGDIYTVMDVAEANGFRVVASIYSTGGQVNGRLLWTEVATGSVVEDAIVGPLVTDYIMRLVAVGNFVFAVWGESGDIRYSRYDMGSDPVSRTVEASLSSELTNAIDPGVFDAGPCEFSTTLWYVGGKGSGANTIELDQFDTSITPVSQQNSRLTSGAGTVQAPLALHGASPTQAWIAWDNGTATVLWEANGAFSPATMFTQRADRLGITSINATEVLVAGNDSTPLLLYNKCNTSGTAGTQDSIKGLRLASQPWDKDSVCALATYTPANDGADPTHYIYQFTNAADDSLLGNPVLLGTLARGTAYLNSSRGTVPHVYHPGLDGRFVTGINVALDFAALDSDTFVTDRVGVDVLRIDGRVGYGVDHRYLTAPWGPSLFMAGAQGMLWDGDVLRDTGHTMRPDFATASAVDTGTATYKYRVVWEWANANGQIERSAPSPIVTITDGTTSVSISNSLEIPVHIPGNRQDAQTGVRAAIYRTEANGSLYYLVKHVAPSDASTTVTTTDALGDTDLILNEPLYTDGGVLPNLGPPACTHVAEHRERLFAVGLDGDPEGIAFTKPYKLGTAPEWVVDAFVVRIPGSHKLTAVASLDTALVVFSKHSTWLVFGDGPPDSGANVGAGIGGVAGFQVQHVTGDVGCSNPRSIVTTPNGIMFQSGKGIYMLDRGYQMSKAGAAVDRILDSYPIVTAATLVPNRTEVHFAVSDGGAAEDGARILVYDYLVDQWAVDVLGVGGGITSLIAYDGAAVTSPEMWFSDLNGNVYKSDLSNYDDAGAFYAMRAEFGPVWMDTIAGWSRTRSATLTGVYKGAHGLQFDFEYDNDDDAVSAWTDTVTRSEAQMLTAGYPVKVALPRQKARTLRMRITETEPAGAHANIVWTSAVFEAGLKRGMVKLPASAKG